MKYVINGLFNIIEFFKTLGWYAPANLAFKALMWVAYEKNFPLIYGVETSDYPDDWATPFESGRGYYINHCESYYDLLVLYHGDKYACIPIPLIEESNHLWFALERAKFFDKLPHERVTIAEKIKRILLRVMPQLLS